jgi:hypothetical protein
VNSASVGQRARLHRGLQRELAVAQYHRQFGPGQPLILLRAAQQGGVALDPVDRAVDPPGFLEQFDHADLRGQSGRAAPFGQRQAQCLEAIILQHDMRDIVGHRDEHRVALLQRQPALVHLAVERDLDVDLVVRAIDAGRIVDEVGIDPSAAQPEFDPALLRHTQIGALADHACAHLVAVDAVRVIGRIAHLGIGLGLGLHIGADAAEPEQVVGRFQDRGDQPRRIDRVGGDAQHRLRLRRKRDRLLRARPDAAAFGDERRIIIRP